MVSVTGEGVRKRMGKRTTIKSARIRAGKRTFFFDVNVSANDKKYLKITESRFVEDGKDRIYNSFILFPDTLQEFQRTLGEVAGFLSGNKGFVAVGKAGIS